MMHKLKKRTALVTLKQAPENAEFNQLHSALENLARYLKGSSKTLHESEHSWSNICNKQQQFAETFASRYPDKDKLRDMGKKSAQASHKLIVTFATCSESSSAPHWKIDSIVREYLDEISSLSTDYRGITPAYTEVARYTKKVADLQQMKKPCNERVERNLEKLEESKKKYEILMENVIERMQEVYNKRQVALKANYVAYWSSHLRAFDLIGESLKDTRDFVTAGEAELSGLKIGKITSKDVAKFVHKTSAMTSAPQPTSASPEPQPPTEELITPSGNVTQGGNSKFPKEMPSSPIGGSETDAASPPMTAI